MLFRLWWVGGTSHCRSVSSQSSETPVSAELGEATQVGSWREIAGNNGTYWNLYAGATYQKLIDSPAVTAPGASATFMAPLGFSPLQ